MSISTATIVTAATPNVIIDDDNETAARPPTLPTSAARRTMTAFLDRACMPTNDVRGGWPIVTPDHAMFTSARVSTARMAADG